MKTVNPIRYIEEMENISPTVRGIILAIASGAFFASMHGSVRLLSPVYYTHLTLPTIYSV